MNKTVRKVLSFRTVLFLFFIGCFLCMVPASRMLIVHLAEAALGRPLRNVEKWTQLLVHVMAFFATLDVFWYFLWYTAPGKNIWKSITQTLKETFSGGSAKKHLIILFALYVLCYLALLRADYSYADDCRRILSGHKSWVGNSRYIHETLAVFLHTNFFINDISPLTQLVSLAIMALTSAIAAFIITKGNVSKLSLCAATFMGISPFFVYDMSYKFDCPYMALSMLLAVLPFLFTKDMVAYGFSSLLAIILICTAYQAANGAYIVIAITVAFIMWQEGTPWKKIGQFALVSVGCYIVAMLFFTLVLMNPDSLHEGTSINLADGAGGFLRTLIINEKRYLSAIAARFGNIWTKFFLCVTFLTFPVAAGWASRSGGLSKRHGWRSSLFAVAVLITMLLLSYGASLIITDVGIDNHTFMGFDMLVAAIALYNASAVQSAGKRAKYCVTAVTVCLFWGLCVYDTVLGTLYTKQKQYENFRYTLVLADLADFVDGNAENKGYICGNIGPASHTYMEHKNYVLPETPSSGWSTNFIRYWNMDLYFESDDIPITLQADSVMQEKVQAAKLLKDSYYHTIYGNEEHEYFIILKNPQTREFPVGN